MNHIDEAYLNVGRIIPLTFWYASYLRSKGIEVDSDNPIAILVFDFPDADQKGTELLYNGLLSVVYYPYSIADAPESIFSNKTIIDWHALNTEDSINLRKLNDIKQHLRC